MKNKKQMRDIEKFWKMGLVIFFCAVALFFIFIPKEEDSVPHRNLLDIGISLQTNQQITPNAIATNPEFKNIAFETSVPKLSIFSNQMAAVAKAIKYLNPIKKEEPKEYGSWIWTPIMNMTPEYIETILSDAKNNGINVMYVSVDSYLDIFVMPKGSERNKQKEIFSKKLEDFIIRANKKGIKVDAEAGWQNWAEDGNEYKAYAVVNFVKNFNETHQNKFRGFQYDIEPYLLVDYKEKPSVVLKNFVELVDQTQTFVKDADLRFSVVVPDFFDGKDGFTPKFTYNNKKNYVFGHLLDILDRKSDNFIVLMSYRNFAEGQDGAIEISKNEMKTAKNGNHQIKIIIAQETGDVPPSYITFHDTSKKYLGGQIEKITKAFNSHPNFGGIAIHYVNAFLALK